MTILRYEGDSRSIPTLGGSEGVVAFAPQTQFHVVDGSLVIQDPENGNGTVAIGDHMQYRVQVASQR